MKKTEFYPTFGPRGNPDWPQLWRIGVEGFRMVVTKDGKLAFMREIDCQLAIHALAEAGITTIEQIIAASDEEIVRIAMSGLQW